METKKCCDNPVIKPSGGCGSCWHCENCKSVGCSNLAYQFYDGPTEIKIDLGSIKECKPMILNNN